MADEVNAPASADATNTVDMPTRSVDAVAEPAVAEAKPAEDGIVATEGVAEVPQANDAQEDAPAKEDTTADATADTAAASDDAEVAPATDPSPTTETPAKKAANGKRKSGAGVPEHKKKTPAKKKKAVPELRLDAQPGQMYMVAMRGYQPWPVIVCDEEMLPESLLSKRPVSAKRIDGTYREDFLEGGKNAKDRRYPIMFLATNEFAWQVNTELLTFDLEEVKKDVESGNSAKKNKALTEAYRIAAEGHDLAYFKQLLASHEQAMQEDAEQREAKEQQKKEKVSKAAKRKSTAADESDDIDDDAAPSAKKAKATKKRKKGEESDGEQAAKTPKTKLKLTNKTPKSAFAARKTESKSKSKKKVSEEPVEPEEPPMSAEERISKREKQVLYLRHRLQKGFLSRDQAPKDEDMSSMSDYLKQLEAHDDLEAEVIKKTKVHKVLKAIMKLESIPKEDEYNFKQRSNDLLHKWGGSLAADPESAATASVEPTTNGAKHDDEKSESAKAETPVEKKDGEEKEASAVAEPVALKAADSEGDIAMTDADKEAENSTTKDAPAAPADVVPSTEDGGDTVTETKAEPATVDTEMTTA